MYAISAFDDLQFFHLRNEVLSLTECKICILRVPKQAVFLIKRAKIGILLMGSVPKRVKKHAIVCQIA